MGKISEAQEILKNLGLPIAQQNEMSALTLLALCNIREDDYWKDATRDSKRITKDIMSFVNENADQNRLLSSRWLNSKSDRKHPLLKNL